MARLARGLLYRGMNSTPSLSRVPIASDPAQMSATAPGNSVKSDTQGRDFAAALTHVEAKPSRKSSAHKSAQTPARGEQLPPVGNPMPPAAVRASVSTAVSTPAIAGAAADGNAARHAVPAGGSAVAGDAIAGTPNATIDAAPPRDANGALPDPTAVVTMAALLALPVTNIPDLTASLSASHGPALTSTPPQALTPGTSGVAESGPISVTSDGAGLLAAGANPPGADAATAALAATNSLASKPTADATGAALASSRSNPQTAPAVPNFSVDASLVAAAANSDPSGQAAAMAAAGAAISAPSSTVASALDADSTLSATGALLATGAAAKGVNPAAPNTPSVPAVAAAASRAAAAAAAVVQAVATAGDATITDKHAHTAPGDASLSSMTGDGAAGLAQLSSAAPSPDPATAPTLHVAAGVDTPEFGQGIADRVSWMVDNNLSGARLQVNPPQLGPIEVRIAVQAGHAQVWMTSHSAVTRDALETSSSKLREMLSAQGFGQVSVDISQRSFQESSSQAQSYDWSPSAERSVNATSLSASAGLSPRSRTGGLDAYA
jgi:flagellar hook-length control protein FliK